MRMLRWMLLVIVAVLAVVASVRFGARSPERSESAAIRAVADVHAREVGGSGQGTAWLEVTCGRGVTRRVYRLDVSGRILSCSMPGA